MSRPVVIHSALLALALTAAYFVWTREPTGSEDDVTILNLRGNLDKAIYSAPDRTITISRKRDDRGVHHQIRAETMVAVAPPPEPAASDADKQDGAATADKTKQDAKAPPADAAKPDAPQATPDPKATPDAETKPVPTAAKPTPPEPKKQKKTKVFIGNEAVEQLMKSLANLSAVRSLGQLEPDKLKSFGLSEAESTLTLVQSSSPRIFFIGGKTFGNQDTYIQNKEDGRVYVIRPQVLQDFQYAEARLMERKLLGFELSEVQRATIAIEGESREVVQQNHRDPINAYWAAASEPDKRQDLYRNWFDKLNRLRSIDYLPPDKPTPVGLKELFVVDFFSGDKQLDTLKVFKHQTLIPGAAGTDELGGGDYYAQSGHGRYLVKISKPLGDELARDLPSLSKQ